MNDQYYIVIFNGRTTKPSYVMDSQEEAVKYAKQHLHCESAKVYKLIETHTFSKFRSYK